MYRIYVGMYACYPLHSIFKLVLRIYDLAKYFLNILIAIKCLNFDIWRPFSA